MRYVFFVILFLSFSSHIESMCDPSCDLDCEDFTGSSSANPPNGWIRGDLVFIGNNFIDNGGGTAVSFNAVGEYMISPEYSCADTFCFDYNASSANSNFDIEMSYTQDDATGTPTWIPLDTISLTGGGTSPTGFVNHCVTIPTSSLIAPFNVRMKWEMIARTGGSFYFDNVCVKSGVCSVTPTKFEFKETPNGCNQTNVATSLLICATDANGYVDTSYTDNISLMIATGSGNLTGTTMANATQGCFLASAIIDQEGSYSFSASSTSNGLVGTSQSLSFLDDCPNLDTLKIMSYNILNYPDGRDDCGPNTVVPQRWDTLGKIMSFADMDVLMICELQNSVGADSVLSHSLNINGVTKYAAASFVPNQSTASTTFNNMFYYNSEKLTLHAQTEVLTGTRDFNKYTVYANDPGLATHNDTVFIDFYMSHLKAGSATSDSIRRADDCMILRNYLDTLPERNNVLGGDLNFYTSSEQAYQILISGVFPFDDPADAEGPWDGNPSYATVLTQSSRSSSDPTYDCGFNGGNDSRFDFLLNSTSIRDSTMNVSYIADSYTPFGNDGSIYNKAINDPGNTSGVPDSVLNAMFYMSDHLPVVQSLQVTYPDIIPEVDSCNLVYTTADTGLGSLRQAISCSQAGDTIVFSSDIHGDTIVISSDSLVFDKDLVISSTTAENVTISSIMPQTTGLKVLIKINTGITVTMSNIALSGAYGPKGSCITNAGNLTCENVIFGNGGRNDLESTLHNLATGSIIFKFDQNKLVKD